MKMYARNPVLVLLAAVAAFAAPSLAAQEKVSPIELRRAWLGIGYDTTDAEVVVRRVAPGSPAQRAGIEAGEVIVRIEAGPASADALVAAVADLEPGDAIRLRIRDREGRERDVELVAAPRPSFFFAQTTPGGRTVVVRLDTLQNAVRAYLDSARLTLERVRPPQIAFERTDSTLTLHLDGESVIVFNDSLRRHVARLRVRADSLARVLHDEHRLQADSLRRLFTLRADSFRAHADSSRAILERMLYVRDSDGGAPVILRASGLGSRAVAGAELAEINAGLGSYFETDEGVLVLRVLPGTPADRAGLESGDVIVQAGERAVASIADLRLAVATHPEGEPIPLGIVRHGSAMTLPLEHEE